MSDNKVELTVGLIGDDHVLSLFNIQSDQDLKLKFQMISPSEWKNIIHLKVKNYGLVGETTQELVKKFKGNFSDQVATLDYALVMIGTNDVVLDVPISEIVQNLRTILLAIKKCDVTPIFCTLLPLAKEDRAQTITDINSMMTIFCAPKGIKVFDLNLSFNNGEDLLDNFYDIGDGVHLTQEGYMFLADNLLLRVREIIAEEFEEYQGGYVAEQSSR
nr:GDSL-type esterase/lipase family protein [Candidatus Sigynarchaeota archaeon]